MFLSCTSCVLFHWRSLPQADHSSREVLLRVCIVGNVETSSMRPARVGLLRQRKKILQRVTIVRKAKTTAPYRSQLAPTALLYETPALYLHSPMRH